MDRNADDPNPDLPPGASPQELEEALKWLEELAARQSLASDADKSALASLESPFSGLIESDEGDLPDWLREAPSAAAIAAGEEEGEIESRLDWLAKMAERESIEELPTLEWRQLSEPARDAALASLAGQPEEDDLDTLPPREFMDDEPTEASAEVETPGLVWEQDAGESTTAEGAVELVDEPLEPVIDAADPMDVAEVDAARIEVDDLPGLADLGAEVFQEEVYPAEVIEEVSKEHLLDALPPNEELPSIDDLDAAMAWIEELAASQDAPIEDVPSVADRALASKLMLEAGLSPDAFETGRQDSGVPFGDLSLLEGNTPVNAFVEAEDFADTIILVETIIAEQAASPQMPLESSELQPSTPFAPEEAFVDAIEPPADELTFDEAMAFLDGLASMQDSSLDDPSASVEIIETVEAEAEQVERADDRTGEVEETPEAGLPESTTEIETPSDALLSEAPPWLLAEESEIEEPNPIDELMEVESGAAEWIEPMEEIAMAETPPATNGHSGVTLEEALRAVDSLALPAGVTLAEIDMSLRQRALPANRRELPAVLDWLETALSAPPERPVTDLVTGDLIDRMPDDPDAVLDWLMQLSGEEAAEAYEQAHEAGSASEAFVATTGAADTSPEGWVEADLMSMPDDPDEAIAWLEGLASGYQPETPPTLVEAPAEQLAVQPEEPEALEWREPAPDDSRFDEPVLDELEVEERVSDEAVVDEPEPIIDELVFDEPEPVMGELVFDDLVFEEPLFEPHPVVVSPDDEPTAAQPPDVIPDEMPTPSSLVITRPRQRRGRIVQEAAAESDASLIESDAVSPPSLPDEAPTAEMTEPPPDAMHEPSAAELSSEVETPEEAHPRPLVRARPRRPRKGQSESHGAMELEAMPDSSEGDEFAAAQPGMEPPPEGTDGPSSWIDLLKPLP